MTANRCDLLSFFAKLIFTTTIFATSIFLFVLWFAFVLCKTDIYNNLHKASTVFIAVVICFRSLQNWYLQQQWFTRIKRIKVVICFRSLQNWYLQQLIQVFQPLSMCCDLLSFFAKLIFTTTKFRRRDFLFVLWFAFVLCKTDIYNNRW